MSATETPRHRRDRNIIPIDVESASARFRCEAYLCSMTGHYCAGQCARAARTHAGNRDACLGCDAGTARVRMLEVGPVRCWVFLDGDGTRCGKEPAEGKSVCAYHWAHGSGARGTGTDSVKVRLTIGDRALESGEEAAERKRIRREKGIVAKQAWRDRQRSKAAFVCVVCDECGAERRLMGYPAADGTERWCGPCKQRARDILHSCRFPRTSEYVARYLGTPEAERDEAFASKHQIAMRQASKCAQCGTERKGMGGKPASDPLSVYCGACTSRAKKRIVARGDDPSDTALMVKEIARGVLIASRKRVYDHRQEVSGGKEASA